MQYILENDVLRITVNSFGAELKSVFHKNEEKEYMWQADPKFWGRTSPVLFPFVGSLKNKEYFVKGTAYPMGQHGFARDMEHRLILETKDSLWFSLKSSPETLAKYPFVFELRIGYQLTENRVKVIWEVENPSAETLPFSIGAHPAFFCPRFGEPDKAGYQLTFGKFSSPAVHCETNIEINPENATIPVKEIHHHGNTRDTGLALTEDLVLPLTEGACSITADFFDRCTYMIEGNQANSVGIKDPSGREYITVLFDTPLFAIWSPEEKNAPFLCIEPWYGRCDHKDFQGELKEREFTNFLPGGETFHSEYVMKFN